VSARLFFGDFERDDAPGALRADPAGDDGDVTAGDGGAVVAGDIVAVGVSDVAVRRLSARRLPSAMRAT
jgi:hypothetical protein